MGAEAGLAASPPHEHAERAEVSAEFAALWQAQYPRLVRALALSGLGAADAEDVAQEAFARTLGHFWRVRRGDNPAGYVFRVAFRLARRRAGAPLLEPPHRGDAPDAEATTRAAVEAALAVMPPARRRCAVACLLAGLTPHEVARALHCAPGTVRKHLAAARADLQRALDEDAADVRRSATPPTEPSSTG